VKTAGAVPFSPLDVGTWVGATVVTLADMLTSNGLVGRLGTMVGPNEMEAAVRDMGGVEIAGELGSCILCMLTAE
jgi:hypothetical protein